MRGVGTENCTDTKATCLHAKQTAMRIDVRRLIYASGNYGKNILWGTAEITLLFMMTDMLGVSPAMAGLILLGSLVVDGMLDPLVGHIADRLQTPLGRYGPLILLGAPLCALSFSALYALPLWDVHSLWIIIGLVIAFRIAYSFIDLPHNALMTHVTGDSRARGRLAGYRFFFSSLASLTLALSLAPLVEAGGGTQISPRGLALYAGLISALSCVVMIISWATVRARDAASARTTYVRLDPVHAIRALLTSRAYRTALLAGSLGLLSLPLFGKSLLYLAVHLLGDPGAASRLLTAMVAGQFVGLPLWIYLSARWEKARALQFAHLIAASGLTILAICLLALPFAAMGACLLVGIGACGVYTIIWGMIADCVEDVLAQSGQRPEGMLFALAIFGQKAALAIGVGAYGLVLQAVGYAPHTALTPASLMTICIFAFAIPTLGSLGCIAVLNTYDLSHERHAALEA